MFLIQVDSNSDSPQGPLRMGAARVFLIVQGPLVENGVGIFGGNARVPVDEGIWTCHDEAHNPHWEPSGVVFS